MSNPDDPAWVWFPNVKSAWSLDVVNLLVVIGESSIAEHAQAITASLPGMLPRILPAPQALLKPSRPTRMPETHARMTGVYSGTTLDSVGFFANIITPLDSLAPFSFKILDIKHSDSVAAECVPRTSPTGSPPHRSGIRRFLQTATRGARRDDDQEVIATTTEKDGHRPEPHHHHHGHDEESAPGGTVSPSPSSSPAPYMYSHPAPRRRFTARERAQDLLTSPAVAVGGTRPAVPAKLSSPVHVLSILSCLLSAAIVATAVRRDGTAILAISLISLASTVIGYASFWRPILMERKHTNEVPRGDVLIRTREGAFVLVRCSEEVARELYSGTEECDYYVGGNAYRALMAIGTMLLMLSVVLLGNCTWELKVFIGASYILLNGLYWGLGMIPRSYFWDLSRYEWTDVTPDDAASAHEVTRAADQREGRPSFTRTLWYAIRETGLTGWVERSGAAPSTEQWRKWLREAEEAAQRNERAWPAVQRKDDILKEKLRDGHVLDRAAQHAPATEVRLPVDSGNNRWTKDGTF